MSAELDASFSLRELVKGIEGEIVKVFDGTKVNNFAKSVSDYDTIYKLTKGIDVDVLEEMLELINLYHNSQRISLKVKDIFKSIESDVAVDYFTLMSSGLEFKYE